MSSSSTASTAKYPYPSEVQVADFVPIKLSPANYAVWRRQMLDFLESQGLVEFVKGGTPPPPLTITVWDSAGGTKEIENEDYVAWKRSDELVRGWILFTLAEDALFQAVRLKTAKSVWNMLERIQNQPLLTTTTVVNIEGWRNLSQYLQLHRAALTGDWESASKFFTEQDPEAVKAPITVFSETALLVAVSSEKRNHFVRKLVELMSPDDVAIPDIFGFTALHMAAQVGNMEAARLLVAKNNSLPNIWNRLNRLPIHQAAKYGRREMVLYLLEVTKADAEPKLFKNDPGVILVHSLIANGLFDVALFVLERYPNLAEEGISPLESMAIMPSAFPSGTQLNVFQRLIYSCVPITSENFQLRGRGQDVENLADNIVSERQVWYGIIWKVAENLVPQIKYVKKKKLKHHQALQLVKFLCEKIVKLDYYKAKSLLEPALKTATCVGINEVVEEILAVFPTAVFYENEKNQTIFHLAILNRRENVFNLIYQFASGHMFIEALDALMNNGLHAAGNLEKRQQLNLRARAPGAALQVQRELQWFQEVENFTRSQIKEQPNAEGKTPALVFTETHKELVEEGEEWMKDTANSCTIVAALIATIVFAASISVPGGNGQSSGHPIFSRQKAFIIFGISDALALFTSTTSVLMFLSILTARHGESDFLYALPKRLIIGLVTLFLSIISMMVAFISTLYLVFGYDRKEILIPAVALACVPVTLFMFLQLPLLLDMIKSTYKPSIFGKQRDRILA